MTGLLQGWAQCREHTTPGADFSGERFNLAQGGAPAPDHENSSRGTMVHGPWRGGQSGRKKAGNVPASFANAICLLLAGFFLAVAGFNRRADAGEQSL